MPRKSNTRTLETDLDKLAKRIASDVLKADVSFKDRLEAFKALSNYHIAERKVATKEPPTDEDADGLSLDAIRRRINDNDGDSGAMSRALEGN